MQKIQTKEEAKVQTSQTAQEQKLEDNPLFQIFNTQRMLKYSILVTRLGFIIILIMTLLMKGKHFWHFVVMFFLTFGLNASLLYYRSIYMKEPEGAEDIKEEQIKNKSE